MYIGIEDLAANALIGILARTRKEDEKPKFVRFATLLDYGMAVINKLKKDSGEEATLTTKKGETLTLTLDSTAGWKFAYTEDTKGAALTVTLKADGSTSIAGALPNGTDAKGKAVTIKVAASGYANVGGMRDGAILADFAPVLTVNKVKTALAITTNLWFDRLNDHAEGAGEAKFAK